VRVRPPPSFLSWIVLSVAFGEWLVAAPAARAVVTTTLDTISISTSTGEKPQSKAWYHAETWWVVLPSDSPAGTWIWRLESDDSFTAVLRLSTSRDSKADVLVVGGVTHVLLCDSSGSSCSGSPELVSIEYDEVQHSYQAWSARPTATPVSLPGNETSTLAIDSTGRMWIATTDGGDVNVLYSDPPYTSISSPITINPGNVIDGDDISLVMAFGGDSVGVLWSDQNEKLFGFRQHWDADAPNVWSIDESPASQSSLNVGAGMSDDHLNVAVAADGTLYVAVKTGYDNSNYPKIALLVRRPDGTWDDLHEVDTSGTRPIVLLNVATDTVQVLYTSDESGGDILMRESPTSDIQFGSEETLMQGSLNNVTSTKQNCPLPAECGDGVDNDGDGFIDYPDDPSCIYPEWDDESNSAGILLAEDFSTSTGPFIYRDDAFYGTAEPNHADGSYDSNGGVASGALTATIGGDAIETSGGWATTFQVINASIPVNIEVGYQLLMDGGYESDEHADALLAIDGVLYGVPPDDFMWRFVGDGDSPSTDMESGWQTYSLQLTLAAGNHEIVVGVFNNKSTTSGEISTLGIDRVSVTLPINAVPLSGPVLLFSVFGSICALHAMQRV